MLHEVFVEAYEDGDIPYYELDFIVAVFPKRGSIYSRETLTRVTIPMGGR